MKKLFTVLLVAAASLVATTAQAQVSFGLKGGLNVTNMSLDSKVLDASNQAGFFVGPTLKFTVPVVGLGFDVSALYDQRQAKLKATDEEIKQQSIQIPVNIRYGFGLGDMASLYFFAGPQFGFNVGDKESKVNTWTLKSSNLSANFGLGLMLVNHLQVSANYNLALGKTGEVSVLGAAGTATGISDKTEIKNNAWQIAIAYYF